MGVGGGAGVDRSGLSQQQQQQQQVRHLTFTGFSQIFTEFYRVFFFLLGLTFLWFELVSTRSALVKCYRLIAVILGVSYCLIVYRVLPIFPRGI